MTDEERKNRNPAPELSTFRIEDCPELFVKDLEQHKVYILQMAGRPAMSINYGGPCVLYGHKAHRFDAPRTAMGLVLFERPGDSETLEDGRGIKVTIRKYNGPDA